MNTSKEALETELSSDQLISLGKNFPLFCLPQIFEQILPKYDSGVEALTILVNSPLYELLSKAEPIATALYLFQEIAKRDDVEEIKQSPIWPPLLAEQYRLLELVEEKSQMLQREFQLRGGSLSGGYSQGLSCQLKTLHGLLEDVRLENTSLQPSQLTLG